MDREAGALLACTCGGLHHSFCDISRLYMKQRSAQGLDSGHCNTCHNAYDSPLASSCFLPNERDNPAQKVVTVVKFSSRVRLKHFW